VITDDAMPVTKKYPAAPFCAADTAYLMNVSPTQNARDGIFSNDNVELRALPGKRYYIQYPSLEFCEAGRRKVLEEQRSTIERVGRIDGLRSIAAVCTSGKRPTRETETERELDSAIRNALGR